MRISILAYLPALLMIDVIAAAEDPPIEETRLTIHALVREDFFAGFRAGNMTRLARGEENVEKLLKSRPGDRGGLLAWKGGGELFRAVLAHEDGQQEEFKRLFDQAKESFAEAKKVAPRDGGVLAVVGGSYVLFTDRLPKEHQEASWKECYDNYHMLWQYQQQALAQLPRHIKGELLAGLVQSCQRLGRTEELNVYLDKMIEVLPDTQYSRMAEEWKDDPKSAVGQNISCKYCHAPGRLSARLAALE